MEVRFRVQTDEVRITMTGGEASLLYDALVLAKKHSTIDPMELVNCRVGIYNAVVHIKHHQLQGRKKAKEIELPIVETEGDNG